MQLFITVSCILAVVSAGHHAPAHHNTVIGAHGVPLESSENVAARAFHQAAHSKALSFHHNAAATAAPWVEESHYGAGNDNSAWASPIATHVAHTETVRQWTGPQHLPVVGHNGVPVDTHENNARRAFHHAAHAEAVARHGHDNSYEGVHGSGSAAVYGAHAEPIHQWTGPQHLAVIGHNGVPVDTNENNARRAFHHAAHVEAASRSGHGSGYHGVQGYATHANQVEYAAHAAPVHQWTGPQHLAVIGHNGVPVDTNENNARRAFHHNAYSEALTRNGGHSSGYAAHAAPVSWNNNGDSYSHGHQW